MALVGSVLTANSSTTNTTSGYVTDTIAPAADAVIVLVVGYSVSSGTAPDPAVTGLGLTWEEFTSSEAARSIAIWRAKGTGTSGGITIAPPGGTTYTSGYWAVIQFTGADLTAAIGQVGVGSGSGTAATVSLPEAVASGAATVAGFMTSVQTTATPRTNWTEAADLNNSAPTSTVQAQYKIPGEQTGSAEFAATGNWRAVIVSVLPASGASTTTVTPNVATSTPAVHAPTATTTLTVAPGVAASAPAVHAPTAATTVTASPDLAASTPVAYGPVVTIEGGPTTVAPDLATVAAEAFAPAIAGSVTVGPDLAASIATVYGPVVVPTVTLEPDPAVSTAEAFAPAVEDEDTYHPHVYVTATLAGDGVSTAVLASDGAGTAVLAAAGGTATLTTSPGTATVQTT